MTLVFCGDYPPLKKINKETIMDRTDLHIQEINLSDITSDPSQPRRLMDDGALGELADSITEHGIIQPILLRKGEDGQNVIVAGERRFRASEMAGRETIPAIFTAGNPVEIALVENLLREDLTPMEEAQAIDRLRRESNYSSRRIAKFLGKAESTISETLSILRLPHSVKMDLEIDPNVPKRILVKIATLKDTKKMAGAWRKYKSGDITRDKITNEKGPDKRSNRKTVLLRFLKTSTKSLSQMKPETMTKEEKAEVRGQLEILDLEIKNTLIKLNG